MRCFSIIPMSINFLSRSTMIYIIIRMSARRQPTCVTLGKGSSTGNQPVVANNQWAIASNQRGRGGG